MPAKRCFRETVRLTLTPPFHREGLLAFLRKRAIAGVEVVCGSTYARVLALPHGHGVVALTLHPDYVDAEFELDDPRDLDEAVAACRRLLDLDADPAAVTEVLGADPDLGRFVRAAPGLRVPGQADGFEVGVRAIVGQQISVARAANILGRYAVEFGLPVEFELASRHGLTHAFGAAANFAETDTLTLGMPRVRGRALIGIAQAVADGRLDLAPGADREATRAALVALPGIGPWTADYIRMRALSDPDVMLETDLIVRRTLDALAISAEQTDSWRPWRSYAAMHLWRASAEVAVVPA